ncbi:hypothetical protein CC86DRAFT_383004 [Ophiobolus disseminans]|uniref:Zn(2)-C6 fungal-type domain-containing protein n=1 Tax=Ophiobolus disseminans TaxID=1469910 RepID=A0A6A6ZZV8_9PLEO|nr:hypothetical protein CC86DRAFT_383004 [Ophiobolus disseminans]
MSASVPRERASRKGQFSCNFCRARKLRCDRPLPCTSCRSRGKTCEFNPTPSTLKSQQPRTPISTGQSPQILLPQVDQSPFLKVTSPPVSFPQTTAPTHVDLLAEIQALRKITQDLEQRVVQNSNSQQLHENGNHIFISEADSNPKYGLPTPVSSHGQVSEIVSHLQLVSMSQISQRLVGVDDIVFKIEHIRAIPQAPTFIAQLGKPTACVWLPTHAEAKVLLAHYIASISCIQHIIHQPSMSAVINDAYKQIEGQQALKPGHIIMLLSIIASATHVWVCCEDGKSDGALFLSSAQAHAQTSMWIKASHTVLNAAQNNSAIELETIQGIAILGCVVCNIEGVSLRYRSLLSTAMLLGREFGLHRIDQKSTAKGAVTLRTEMSRRVWWYLVATDWLMAARFGGSGEGVYQTHPHHMTVNKPCNINDSDIVDTEPLRSAPLDQPTDVSYFLQRLRLAEISRSIVDHNLINATSSNRPSYYAHIMAMDFELDLMIQNVPSFFNLDNYIGRSQTDGTGTIFIQAYMLNSMMHLQRCKLHLAYLTSGPSDNPAYAASRDACLKSAHQIIRAESQLLQSGHPFIQIRLRLAAILYGIFMASIVLLMDACLHRPATLEQEISSGDLAEALRMIRDVKSHSLAAATLHESLMQIVARYRTQQRLPAIGSPEHLETQLPPTPSSGSARPTSDYLDWGGDTGVLTGTFGNGVDQQANGLDDSIFLDQVQWDDLFTGLASSSFF